MLSITTLLIFTLALICHCQASPVTFEDAKFKISEIHDMIKSGTSCVDIIQYFNKRANYYNRKLHAVISFNPRALHEAVRLDEFYSINKTMAGMLHCVPVMLIDSIDTIGVPTTGGVRALRNSVPLQDSTIAQRLKMHGAIILAKTNLAELGQGSDDSETGGLCNNPFDLNRWCGCASTGSGASIASAFGVVGVGLDTDGSVIIPSSYNGLFGLRPHISQQKIDGIIPLNPKRDIAGPMTKHVDDLVLAYSVMYNDTIYKNYSEKFNLSEINIGVITNFLNTSFKSKGLIYYIDSDVSNIFGSTVKRLESYKIKITKMAFTDDEIEQLLTLIVRLLKHPFMGDCTKTYGNLYFNDSRRFFWDSPYNNFEEFATSPLLSKQWQTALQYIMILYNSSDCPSSSRDYDRIQRILLNNFLNMSQIASVDAILMPSSFNLPMEHNAKLPISSDLINLERIASFLGLPVLTFPGDYTKPGNRTPDGLPVGISLIGKQESLLKMFKVAQLYEDMKGNGDLSRLPSSTPLLEEPARTVSSSTSTIHPSLITLLVVFLFNF